MAALFRLLLFVPFLQGALAADVDFQNEILPVLEANCVKCHGPDKQKSGFRLDQRALLLKGGDSGHTALVPGDAAKSFLIEVVKGTDPDMLMPPKGDPLTPEQITLLENWIAQGADWPGQMDAVVDTGADHWAFLPVVRPPVPDAAPHPVDAFLTAHREKSNITANGPADPRTLIRRAAIVLTGLHPTPERVAAFLTASAENADAAYSALVEELLASPHFGERWAQHWLDVIRWAESNGSEANLYRKNAWIYRDCVIRAFNNDEPYDQFIRDQLAGDQSGAGEATGFLVSGPHVPASTVGQEPTAIRLARADRVDEILQTVGASMLGVTIGCARCHNHKFDPVSIRDYYSLGAIFGGVEFGGRNPELAPTHPRQIRARELTALMEKERAILREGAGQWIEDWGGFTELQFPPTTTAALRIEFATPAIWADELEVFGPADPLKNVALATTGTTLLTDETMIQLRGNLSKANDGQFGAQQFVAKAPDGAKTKPWVEIHFPQPQNVSRFRFSANREYYFETDYIKGGGGGKLPGFRVLRQQPDGTWQEIGKTAWAQVLLKKNPALPQALARLQSLIAQLQEEGPQHSFIGRFQTPAVTKVLLRGSPENPGDEVPPAGIEILHGNFGLNSQSPDTSRRMALAQWLTQPEHPLTARVMVNRLWQHVFGSGLVPTTADFGKAGAPPSDQALLDWLATEFVHPTQPGAKPWSTKSILRLLVSSDAFRRSSAPQQDALLADAGAAMLWRFPPRRVEAEVIRDAILQATGKLNPALGGRSYRIFNVKAVYEQWALEDNHGPDTWRRMIYQERMRRVDDRMFSAFDFPDCGQVSARRTVSTTPLQALNLMNSPFVIEQSEFLAARARAESGDPDSAIRRAFSLLLTREPTDEELAACRPLSLDLVCRSLINSNEFAFLP